MPAVPLLLVDFLDSYTYNIPSYIRRSCPPGVIVSIDVVPYTELNESDVISISTKYCGIILSPGPGTVDCADDLGAFVPALLAPTAPPIPVFGVCLGFQAICKAFGGLIKRLSMPHHGLISDIVSENGTCLGRKATRYHSLEAIVTPELKRNLESSAWSSNHNDDSRTLQEVKVRGKPLWGVQYHPESVFSTNCESVALPFLHEAASRVCTPNESPVIEAKPLSLPSHDESASDTSTSEHSSPGTPTYSGAQTPATRASVDLVDGQKVKALSWKKLAAQIDVAALLRSDDFPQKEFVVLDSAGKGDWDILAFASSAKSFKYSCRRREYSFTSVSELRQGNPAHGQSASLQDMWTFLRTTSDEFSYVDGPDSVPFWGGFLGYFSYELGLDQLGLEAYPEADHQSFSDYDDVQLLWSSETIVCNKKTSEIFLLSLTQDENWVKSTEAMLEKLAQCPPAPHSTTGRCDVVHPPEAHYVASIDRCQERILTGDSYELCLTALSELHYSPSSPDSEAQVNADLYAALRKDNPAAFASYFNLGGVTFLSASPEEFLAYDVLTRRARMKPIKGTLAKVNPDGSVTTRAQAEQQLRQPKLIAENLMIVDLVRNDLSRLSSQVSCPDLLWVEELPHLYQLVSTIEAVVAPSHDAWDLLKSTLPPGSMTGAPKRRSCQILQSLEKSARGLYAGIVGYIDVRGNCRTSVSIRSAAKYPDVDHWKLGAGGAITSLSNPSDEWHERQLKASSVCRSFTQRFQVLETVLWDPALGGPSLWAEHMDRLFTTLQLSSFRIPSDARTPLDLGDVMLAWLQKQLSSDQTAQTLRLSIKVAADASLSLAIVAIDSAKPTTALPVTLDPGATNTSALEPFISRKTTIRDHYSAARKRAGVQGRDEVLLFRPACAVTDRSRLEFPGRDDDLLTEGSYTNVAVFDEARGTWVTPASGCLPGIVRQRLLLSGEVVTGDIRRDSLKAGMKVKLFNSVRGVFEGIFAS